MNIFNRAVVLLCVGVMGLFSNDAKAKEGMWIPTLLSALAVEGSLFPSMRRFEARTSRRNGFASSYFF